MEAIQVPIPFLRMQFHLLGGGRRFGAIGFGYLGLLVVASIALRRMMMNFPTAAVIDYLIQALGVAQCALLYAGGCNAIHRATLRDFQTRMNESHRLTPLSSAGVVLGYLLGSTLQIQLLFGIGLVYGALLSFLGTAQLGGWMFGSVLQLAGAAMLWSLMVLIGVGTNRPLNPGGILVVLSMLAVPMMFGLPGGAIFSGVYSATLGFMAATGVSRVPAAGILFSVMGSLTLASFWIYVAAARYRRPDLPAFNAYRGMILLALWLLISFGSVAAYQYTTLTSMTSFGDEESLPVQWTITLIVSLIVAAIPMSGAVLSRRLVARGIAPRDWTDRIGDDTVALLTFILVASLSVLGAVFVVVALQWTPQLGSAAIPFRQWRPWLWTLAEIAVALLTVWTVVVIAVSRCRRPIVAIGTFLLFAWGFPPVIDLILAGTIRVSPRDDFVFSALLVCSPGGAIAVIWSGNDAPIATGFVVQLVLALVMSLAAFRARRSWSGVNKSNCKVRECPSLDGQTTDAVGRPESP